MSDSFNTWTDAEVQEFFATNGFICARKLDSGDWVGIYISPTAHNLCMHRHYPST